MSVTLRAAQALVAVEPEPWMIDGRGSWDRADGLAIARVDRRLHRALWPDAPARLGRVDRASRQALLVARALLAGLDPAGRPLHRRTGVILGTGLGCAHTNARFHRALVEKGPRLAPPLLFGYTIPSAPAGEIAIAHGLRGTPLTVMAGALSAVAALGAARRALLRGRCDACLVVVGDVVSQDRAALWRARGEQGERREAWVALWLDRQPGPAQLEVASLGAEPSPAAADPGSAQRAAAGRDEAAPGPYPITCGPYLGASGAVALARWLTAPSVGSDASFAARLSDGAQRGELRARRSVGD